MTLTMRTSADDLPVALARRSRSRRPSAAGRRCPGSCLQAAEVLERVDEGAEAALGEEGPQAQLDARGVAQRLAPLAARAAAPAPRRTVSSYSAQSRSTSASATCSTTSTSSLTGCVLTGDARMRAWTSTLSPSVSATSRMLSPKRTTRRRVRLVDARGRAHPGADARLDRGSAPVARDDLARHAAAATRCRRTRDRRAPTG